jgi:polysaccharide transporter, PST family
MKRTQAAHVLWSVFEAAFAALCSFASAFVIARIIGPIEVGIGAAVIAVHAIRWFNVKPLTTRP